MEVKENITIEELRKLGVEGERKLLLSKFIKEYEKGIAPTDVNMIPKEVLLLEVSELYEQLLKVEYEKYRLASFVFASGNFSAFAQYCQDTENTTSSEYQKVAEEIGERELRQDRETLAELGKGIS